jgi:hypothetical protein
MSGVRIVIARHTVKWRMPNARSVRYRSVMDADFTSVTTNMTQLAKIDDHEDRLMGQQFSAELKEAVSGMWRVVRVGGMVSVIRQRLISKLEISGKGVLPRGKNSDGGIKKWVEQYAPDSVSSLSTAYRFEDVFGAVKKAYELPARVAKKLTFEAARYRRCEGSRSRGP